MVLVGYSVTESYRLFDPEKGNIITNRDVVFDEKKRWEWNFVNSVTKETVLLDLDEIEPEFTDETQVKRSQRARQHYEVFPDTGISEEGELLLYAMAVESEPMSLEDALLSKNWKSAMEEELVAIEKKQYMGINLTTRRKVSHRCKMGIQN